MLRFKLHDPLLAHLSEIARQGDFHMEDPPKESKDGKDGKGKKDGEDEKTYTEADVQALKQKNFDLIGKNKKLAARAELLGDMTDDELEAELKLAKDTREKKIKDEGNWQAEKTQLLSEHGKVVLKEKTRADKAEAKLYDLLVVKEVDSAVRDIAPDSVDVLRPHITKEVRVMVEDGEPVARVVDAKGNVRIADAAGTPMTIQQLVETFKENTKFAGVFPASGANGSGSRGSGNGSGGKVSQIVITAEQGRDTVFYRSKKAEAEKLGIPFLVAG